MTFGDITNYVKQLRKDAYLRILANTPSSKMTKALVEFCMILDVQPVYLPMHRHALDCDMTRAAIAKKLLE